jgi:peptidoglycan/LPS O-acetylase OafA/YrhL
MAVVIGSERVIPSDDSVSAKPHLAYLDGLRAVCALYVVLYHWPFIYAPNSPIIRMCMHGPFGQGHDAVDVFIVISGFCLSLPVSISGTIRGGAVNFVKRRARRILPTYYFAVTFSLILIVLLLNRKTGTVWDFCLPVTPAAILWHLLLIQDLRAKYARIIDAPLWSIAVEWKIYFLFPLFIFIWRRWGVMLTALASTAISLSYLALLRIAHISGEFVCPQYIILFALGLCGAMLAYSPKYNQRITRKFAMFVSAVGTVILCVLIYRGRWTVLDSYINDITVGLIAATLMSYAAGGPNSVIRKLLSWQPLAFIGTFSYSIYLIHGSVEQCWGLFIRQFRLNGILELSLSFTIGTMLVVLASWVFFLICERPFIGSKQASTIALQNTKMTK